MHCNQKYCGGCRFFKPRSEFNKRQASADGLAYRCRPCTKKYQATYRQKYPKTAEQLAKQRAYNVQYRAKQREAINSRRQASRREQRRIHAIRYRYAGMAT